MPLLRSAMRFPYRGAGIGLVKGDGILLGVRSKKPFVGIWSVPGGGREKGETYLEDAKREFLEETGCDMDKLDCTYLGSWTLSVPPFFHWTTFFFDAKSFDMELRPSEFSRLEWVGFDRIPKLKCRPFTRFEMAKAKRLVGRF